jgi:hypothetical protein
VLVELEEAVEHGKSFWFSGGFSLC